MASLSLSDLRARIKSERRDDRGRQQVDGFDVSDEVKFR
jgi:hypothetical protein